MDYKEFLLIKNNESENGNIFICSFLGIYFDSLKYRAFKKWAAFQQLLSLNRFCKNMFLNDTNQRIFITEAPGN